MAKMKNSQGHQTSPHINGLINEYMCMCMSIKFEVETNHL